MSALLAKSARSPQTFYMFPWPSQRSYHAPLIQSWMWPCDQTWLAHELSETLPCVRKVSLITRWAISWLLLPVDLSIMVLFSVRLFHCQNEWTKLTHLNADVGVVIVCPDKKLYYILQHLPSLYSFLLW